MNERIRKLAEQAGITTNLDTDYFEKDMNQWVDYYSEKFAELIIEEQPKREWVGLTDEEQITIASTPNKTRHWIVCETESRLKEKNAL